LVPRRRPSRPAHLFACRRGISATLFGLMPSMFSLGHFIGGPLSNAMATVPRAPRSVLTLPWRFRLQAAPDLVGGCSASGRWTRTTVLAATCFTPLAPDVDLNSCRRVHIFAPPTYHRLRRYRHTTVALPPPPPPTLPHTCAVTCFTTCPAHSATARSASFSTTPHHTLQHWAHCSLLAHHTLFTSRLYHTRPARLHRTPAPR